MRSSLAIAAASAAVASAALNSSATLESLCTVDYVKSILPGDNYTTGILTEPSSVTAEPLYNQTISDQYMFPNAVISMCNVTFAYTHAGRNDTVLVNYWLPPPNLFENRFLVTGGGGLAINSGTGLTGSLGGGVEYGAAAGLTDGGFGSFTAEWDAVFLLANGSINWESTYLFGYQAIHEMNVLGQALTKGFYQMGDTRLWTYYQACSEGGREGWSQVQRFGDIDGAIIGAPAIRYGFQQPNHLFSNIVEYTLDYYPSTCELEQIMNLTIAACDPLDGKTDGVVSRTDLCILQFDVDTLIGKPYYCAATTAESSYKKRQETSSSTIPAQNGTITAQAIEVVKQIWSGPHDSHGNRFYLSYQPSAAFTDAATEYDATTGTWELDISGLGGEWITRFLDLQNSSTLASLDGVTYDTLKMWMYEGWQKYQDSLQTTWPDLSVFRDAGGKVLHYHGESDYSIPTASSVRYHDSVRQIMYPHMGYNESQAALAEWYRLYLVPGGSHCAPNEYEPNGCWPQTNFQVMIDWVEKDIVPVTLNATVLLGNNVGDNQQICTWPLRPLWTSEDGPMECVFNAESLETWYYDFTGISMPVY